MYSIEISNLTKKFKEKIAVNNISLKIKEGELFALLGTNGAGKTTTIKMLSTLILPTSGEVKINGLDVIKDRQKVKEILNVSPQETAIAPNLSVRENLEFMAGVYQIKNKEEKIPVEENIPATELSSNRLVKEKNEKRIETEQSQKKNSKEDEEFIAKLNILINENMAGEELSIKFLTDKMAMSRASLYNKVKLLTGLGVNDYINKLRIEKSVYLLTNTNMNINEISYEVGFSYPRYFSTSFKQVKGMTPTRFKEENKRN